jgi:hypothetical protein
MPKLGLVYMLESNKADEIHDDLKKNILRRWLQLWKREQLGPSGVSAANEGVEDE